MELKYSIKLDTFKDVNLIENICYIDFLMDMVSRMQRIENKVKKDPKLKKQFKLIQLSYIHKSEQSKLLNKINRLNIVMKDKFNKILNSYINQFESIESNLNIESSEEVISLISWLKMINTDIEMLFDLMYSNSMKTETNISCDSCKNLDTNMESQRKYSINNLGAYKVMKGDFPCAV